ncbi:Adenylate cyclase [Diplonema papillatum]|nr:Adenylate cyclase [Diplonema papillatum]
MPLPAVADVSKFLGRFLGYVLRRAVRETDTPLVAHQKETVVTAGFVLTLSLAFIGLALRDDPLSLVLLSPALTLSIVLPMVVVVTRTIHDRWIDVTLACWVFALTIIDWRRAASMLPRIWMAMVAIVDVSLLLPRSHMAKFNTVMVSWTALWLVVCGVEEAYGIGLYDAFRDGNLAPGCDCERPPCPVGTTTAIRTGVPSILILLLLVYATDKFARGSAREQARMAAVVDTANDIATSLVAFDLTDAQAKLSESSLPDGIAAALQRLLDNLTEYRPYLPDAVVAFQSNPRANGATLSEVSPPGVETKMAAIVFTDIQSSTATWDACSEGMKVALELHNEFIRMCAQSQNGYEVKTIGDAFMLAFGRAADAVQFSLDAQSGLCNLAWPASILDLPQCAAVPGTWAGLRVRIGVHWGEVSPAKNQVVGRFDYFGPTVNKAARIESACPPGGVAVSDEVLEQLQHEEVRATHTSLGLILLAGIGRVRLTMLLPSELASRREDILRALHLKARDVKGLPSDSPSSSTIDRRMPTGDNIELISLRKMAATEIIDMIPSATLGTIRMPVMATTPAVVEDTVSAGLSTIDRIVTLTEGEIIGIFGATVAIGWNTMRRCVAHVEHALHFASSLDHANRKKNPLARSMHLALHSGRFYRGPICVGPRKYFTVLGAGFEINNIALTLATNLGVFALFVPESGSCAYIKESALAERLRPVHTFSTLSRGPETVFVTFEIKMAHDMFHVHDSPRGKNTDWGWTTEYWTAFDHADASCIRNRTHDPILLSAANSLEHRETHVQLWS